jgi:alpha-tubulin suppressor-like RCC1 family protein
MLAALGGAPPTASGESGTAAVSWGENFYTQLGAGYKDNWEPSPVSVIGLTSVNAVAAGYHFSLALIPGGTVRAWGGNDYGQLGVGTREESATPVQIPGLSGVKAIDAGGTHAIALLTNKTVRVWGSNEYGELGNGELNPRERINSKGEKETTMRGTGSTVPVDVPGLTNVIAVATGGGTDFALLENGTLMAWGRNDAGQLGIGQTGPEGCKNSEGLVPCSTKPLPVDLSGLPTGVKVRAVSAGRRSAYAVLSNDEVRAWGSNAHGELGDGSTVNSSTPVEVLNVPGKAGKNLTGVRKISGGHEFVLAALQNGQAVGWGVAGNGQLGATGTDACKGQPNSCSETPTLIAGLEKDTDVSAGLGFGFALNGGVLYAFGRNSAWRQLGIGISEGPEPCGIEGTPGDERTLWCSRTPFPINGLAPIAGMDAGQGHGVAVLQSGSGPAPLLSVTPEPQVLRVTWTFAAAEYRLRSKPLDTKRWGKNTRFKHLSCSAAAPCSYVITDGEAKPREIQFNSFNSERKLEKHRLIDGAPLPPAAAPRSSAGPTINGVGELGRRLTVYNGVWANGPISFAHQWLRCDADGESCLPIKRATGQTYAPVARDAGGTIRVAEKATNTVRSTTAVTGPIHIVAQEEDEEPEPVLASRGSP